jgi:tripartite ATP-independent transporter DctM subunit
VSTQLQILVAAFVLLSLLRVPVGIAMLTAGVAYLLAKKADAGLAAEQVMNAMLQSDVLLAIPMFILCAQLISVGSIGDRLMALAQALVGRIPGGLGHVNVLVNVVFASMSGSAVADAAGPGAVLVRLMRQAGYSGGYAAALTAAAATLAPIIPPSIPFILYAVIANVSVGAMFAAGVVPGALIAVLLMASVAWQARRRAFPRGTGATLAEMPRIALRALLPLGLPVVVLGGIRIGAFTPTEGAAVASLYALVIVTLVFRDVRASAVYESFRTALMQSASVMTIIMGAFLMNYAIAAEQLPNAVAAWFLSMQLSATGFLLGVMALFLVLGCFVDTTVMLLVLVPVLLPTARALGIDLVHFGLVVTVNMMIGMLTPPYGVLHFVMSAVTAIPVREIIAEIWFFCGVLLAALLVLCFVPEITLWLPRHLGLMR